MWHLLDELARTRGIALMQLCEDENEDGVGATAVVCLETLVEQRTGYTLRPTWPVPCAHDANRPRAFLKELGWDPGTSDACWIVGVTSL